MKEHQRIGWVEGAGLVFLYRLFYICLRTMLNMNTTAYRRYYCVLFALQDVGKLLSCRAVSKTCASCLVVLTQYNMAMVFLS